MNLRPISLNKRIFLLVVTIILISVGFETFFLRQHIQNLVMEEGRKKIMRIAEAIARDKRIIAAFRLPDPSAAIQPIAENIRIVTGTSYVVVMNMKAIRYSHPEPDFIGKRFIGGDEQEALRGKKFISQVKRTLGVSQRAFAPILNEKEEQIGVVSVGLLLTEIEQQQYKGTYMLYWLALISILLGLGGAVFLSKNIKKAIFGLEPYQIASLLEERNVILSSVREGVVAIDRENRVILMNDRAKNIFAVQDIPRHCRITDIMPTTSLPLVVQTGAPILDEEHVVNNTVVLINQVPLISAGQTVGAVATLRDMGEIRRLAEELTEVRKYIDALRQQNHEHLNKLHVISGLLQLKEYEEAVGFMTHTVSQKQKMSDFLRARIRDPLVAGLLFSKIDESLRQGIDLSIDPESQFPKIPELLSVPTITIIGNILENAIESLVRSERKDKTIVMSFSKKSGCVEIKIRDNGGGFPAELKEMIYQRGFTTKTSPKNMGMGLFIVRNEVERLKGTIDVSLRDGTEFVVVLPLPAS
ncbi:MAG: ATP-binding protein [Syntrophales bacterium]